MSLEGLADELVRLPHFRKKIPPPSSLPVSSLLPPSPVAASSLLPPPCLPVSSLPPPSLLPASLPSSQPPALLPASVAASSLPPSLLPPISPVSASSGLLPPPPISRSPRNVGDSLIAQFIYTGNGFYLQQNDLMRFSDLIDIIRRRFRFSSSDVFHLQYSSPGCPVIYLHSDLDFQMLFCCAKIYKLDHVDVNVVKDVGSSCSTKSVLFDENFSEIIDENDYLDDGFKDGPTKSYLSDDWGSYLLHKGQKFESVQDFRDKLRKYAVQTGFCYVLPKNDSLYVRAVCENHGTEKFGWEVIGYVAPINNCFYIKEFNNIHTCKGVLRNQTHRQLGSKIVRTCIESNVFLNLGLKPADIMSNFKSTYGFEISYKVASRAKKRCLEKMYGSESDSFSMLSWYKDAVLETNPGSSFVLEVEENTNRFQRVFVSYGGQFDGFKFSLPVLQRGRLGGLRRRGLNLLVRRSLFGVVDVLSWDIIIGRAVLNL
ncbi:hypothetical protein ACLB2K_072571 [Fragaria x ananassa]